MVQKTGKSRIAKGCDQLLQVETPKAKKSGLGNNAPGGMVGIFRRDFHGREADQSIHPLSFTEQ